MFWSEGSVTRARETLSKSRKLGLPWQSNGQHSALPLLRAWVQSLVGELRTKVYKLRGAAKKIKTKRKIPSVAWRPRWRLLSLLELQSAPPCALGHTDQP